MRRVGFVLLTAVLAGQAHGQTTSGQTANALTCGILKAESSQTSSTSQWTIFGPVVDEEIDEGLELLDRAIGMVVDA